MSDKNIDTQNEPSHFETFNSAATAIVQAFFPSFCAGFNGNNAPKAPNVK